MKKLKNILKIGVTFIICVVLLYSLAIRLINAYEVEDTVIEDYNYEEYYAYDAQ
ncbi:MAG: hypothetical protein IKZ96_02895 [Bacilli bacterium]|nr:hypothetical protein [Bacilli bacterium]